MPGRYIHPSKKPLKTSGFPIYNETERKSCKSIKKAKPGLDKVWES
jgi:hypothetical protein